MKTVCINFANGCLRSGLEAARFVDYFRLNGWNVTPRFCDADIVVVAACGYERRIEEKSLRFLSIVNKRKKPSATLMVSGCLAGINGQHLRQEFNAIPLPQKHVDDLDKIVNARVKIRDVEYPNDFGKYSDLLTNNFSSLERFLIEGHIGLSKDFLKRAIREVDFSGVFGYFQSFYRKLQPPSKQHDHYKVQGAHRVFGMKISTGCTGICSYCGIRQAVGPLHSQPMDTIMRQFENGLSRGYRVFRLVADDVGGYGQDNGRDVVKLLDNLFSRREEFVLQCADFSPKWLVQYFSRLSEVISRNANRVSYMEIPMQSGSERILEMMKREYTAADAVACIQKLKADCPELRLHTHVIVGFPGENEKDFSDTLKCLKACRFDKVRVNEYTDRANTEASVLPDKISDKTKKARKRTIHSLLNQYQRRCTLA